MLKCTAHLHHTDTDADNDANANATQPPPATNKLITYLLSIDRTLAYPAHLLQ
jgi:hypothetical protein